MPCSDGGWSEAIREEERKKLLAELIKVSALLCVLCRILDNEGHSLLLRIPGLLAWYDDHKKKDAKAKPKE